MTYTPTPYTAARPVDPAILRRYRELDVTMALDGPDGPDADQVEHGFNLFYRVNGADPDVGIMRDWCDEWFYAMPDGTPVPEPVWAAIDRIDWRAGNGYVNGPDGVNPLLDPDITAWHERNLEVALAEPDYGPDD